MLTKRWRSLSLGVIAASAAATAATAGLATFAPTVASASPRDVHYGTAYEWNVVGVGGNYKTYGGWSFCAEAYGPGTVTCSRGFTVANSVTGSVTVSDGAISDAVGFSVTTSTTLTGGASYNVPKGVLGVVQWRAAYYSRNVTQEQYVCTTVNGACPSGGWHPDNKYATARANDYLGPGFRYT